MTPNQEDALYNFLDNAVVPFTLRQIAEYVRAQDPDWAENLPAEINAFFASTLVAFRVDGNRWISRRGFFENVPFAISPTKLELINGILIPGHRCLPFANPAKMPQEYEFFWKGKKIPKSTSEGPPEDFYLYYGIFGREYAPQIVARDNPENEKAFMECDLYEDPGEVSIRTLDMRHIFRESAFVPGDRFAVRTRDWKAGHFDLEKIGRGEWQKADLDEWAAAAEAGFEGSFSKTGPCVSTEEQVAFAYWHGGQRMLEAPMYSMEEFLYEITENVETVEYGIESRFWFAGRDIPDSKALLGLSVPPDRTPVENILFDVNVPISEFVVRSYVRDALFRNEKDIDKIMERLIPPSVKIRQPDINVLAKYVAETMRELAESYNIFLDRPMGETRRQIGELHNAVIELAANIRKWGTGENWMPKHTFIMLSQIQEHAADLMTDLDCDEAPPEADLEIMENSLESMLETFGDIKEMLREAMNNFRRSNLQLVQPGKNGNPGGSGEVWQTLQISLGGTDVWRRVIVPGNWKLDELHTLIQICLDWKNSLPHQFHAVAVDGSGRKTLNGRAKIQEVREQGIARIEYEYGQKWTIRITFVSSYQPGSEEAARCVAGEGCAPPEKVGGPLRFRKMLAAISGGNDLERQNAEEELGSGFVPVFFDKEKCNMRLVQVGQPRPGKPAKQ
jgi:hypothetical protein